MNELLFADKTYRSIKWNDTRNIAAVFYAPIHKYTTNGSQTHLHNKWCIVLAVLPDGRYHLIGGIVERNNSRSPCKDPKVIMQNLYREVYEEAYYELTADQFLRNLVKCVTTTAGHSANLICICKHGGMSSTTWKHKNLLFKNKGSQFNEISGIVHVPIDDLMRLHSQGKIVGVTTRELIMELEKIKANIE